MELSSQSLTIRTSSGDVPPAAALWGDCSRACVPNLKRALSTTLGKAAAALPSMDVSFPSKHGAFGRETDGLFYGNLASPLDSLQISKLGDLDHHRPPLSH